MFLGGESNIVYIFDTNMEFRYKTDMVGSFITSMILVEKRLYFGTMIGEIYIMEI